MNHLVAETDCDHSTDQPKDSNTKEEVRKVLLKRHVNENYQIEIGIGYDNQGQEIIAFSINHVDFVWKSYSLCLNNNELNAISNVWKNETFENKYESIVKCLGSCTEISNFIIIHSSNEVVMIKISFLVGAREKEIKFEIPIKEKELTISEKLIICEKLLSKKKENARLVEETNLSLKKALELYNKNILSLKSKDMSFGTSIFNHHTNKIK